MKICERRLFSTLLLILTGLLLLAGCDNPIEKQAAQAVEQQPEKVVQVTLEEVVPGDLRETFSLPANLEAWEDLTIAAEIAGPIRKRNFEEGDRVKAGDVLVEIDPETIRSNLNREEENYQVISRKLKRYRDLAAEGLVSTQEIDDLENMLTAAAAALKATKLQLEKCFPKAPINGVVDRHFISRGEFIDVGKPLLRLVQVDKLKVIADVPEKDVPFLSVGQEVEIVPAIINNRQVSSFRGKIEHIAYTADSLTRTYRTKIVIDNSEGLLRPGMIVRTIFERQNLSQVISAPLYAVLDRDGEKVVFVAEDGIARRVPVQTGSSVGQRILVTAGLEPGQQLVVKGQQLLIDGAKIQVQEP